MRLDIISYQRITGHQECYITLSQVFKSVITLKVRGLCKAMEQYKYLL
jgi:hypothetical protein